MKNKNIIVSMLSLVAIGIIGLSVWYFGYSLPRQKQIKEYQTLIVETHKAVFGHETNIIYNCTKLLRDQINHNLSNDDLAKIESVCQCAVGYTYDAIGKFINYNIHKEKSEFATGLINLKTHHNLAIQLAVESCIIDMHGASKLKRI